jgi:PIN domain nuclease of toxin-antitoxin system
MNKKLILDASALLALIQDEKGAKVIQPLLPYTIMSAVNVAEVLTVLERVGDISSDDSLALITDIINTIIPFDLKQASRVARLQAITKEKGLSLGDRACIALGMELNLPVYTADKIWIDIDLPDISIKLIR